MKRIFLSILAIIFPWAIMFIYDDPVGALIAFVLQASVIGWIPASVWAWKIVKKQTKLETAAKKHAMPPQKK